MTLRVTHPFDVALIARGRRRHLKLRQAEVARAAGVGREWLVDLEHGKPTLELGKVLRTLDTLGVEIRVEMGPAPRWTLPYTAEAKARAERLAALRPPSRPRKPRADITPPDDWPLKDFW